MLIDGRKGTIWSYLSMKMVLGQKLMTDNNKVLGNYGVKLAYVNLKGRVLGAE